MDSNFKPYRTGMLTVKEKYVCGREDKINKRCHVYYLCQCDCGKEVIFSGDEIARHPYSCGCTPKPAISLIPGPKNRYSLGYTDGTMLCMLKPERAVYSNSSSGVSGVYFENRRKKWRAQIGPKGKNHFLGYFDKKEDAIQARIEAEVKYWNPLLEKRESIEDNKDKGKSDKEAKK